MAPIQNGDSGVNGCSGAGVVPPGCWTVGLINARHKYLTAETFGFKINANGVSMKKKQVWILEPFGSSQVGGGSVALRSHLNRYLAVDQFGNVTCDSEDKEECGPTAKFEILVADDGSGRWALRNSARGYYVGAMADKLVCEAKVPGEAELWTVHLAARPQVNLKSIGRKRFAHLSESGEEIQVDANVAWGPDTLFTLEFRPEALKYAVHACNDKYLSKEGKLVSQVNQDCLYSVEFHQGCLALRDAQGLYLGPIGSRAALRTRSSAVTKDELFQLEDSLPQASFLAGLNARYVSVKQGIDVTANQEEVSDFETFQLEFDCTTKRWYVRTMQDKYWTLETGGGIQAVADKKSSNALFEFCWGDKGSVSFRANNGKYVTTKKSGQLYANADAAEDDNAKFYFELANRPVLVLKCEQGFVGSKSGGDVTLECNKATYDTILVEKGQKGLVFFQGKNGKYWRSSTGNVTCDGDQPTEGFYLELVEPSRMRIKSADATFLVAAKNGAFTVGSKDAENATQWEY